METKNVIIMFSASAWEPEEKAQWAERVTTLLKEAGFGTVKITDLHLEEDTTALNVVVTNSNFVDGRISTALAAFEATRLVMQAFDELCPIG